jgi:hypothetical protein
MSSALGGTAQAHTGRHGSTQADDTVQQLRRDEGFLRGNEQLDDGRKHGGSRIRAREEVGCRGVGVVVLVGEGALRRCGAAEEGLEVSWLSAELGGWYVDGRWLDARGVL